MRHGCVDRQGRAVQHRTCRVCKSGCSLSCSTWVHNKMMPVGQSPLTNPACGSYVLCVVHACSGSASLTTFWMARRTARRTSGPRSPRPPPRAHGSLATPAARARTGRRSRAAWNTQAPLLTKPAPGRPAGGGPTARRPSPQGPTGPTRRAAPRRRPAPAGRAPRAGRRAAPAGAPAATPRASSARASGTSAVRRPRLSAPSGRSWRGRPACVSVQGVRKDCSAIRACAAPLQE